MTELVTYEAGSQLAVPDDPDAFLAGMAKVATSLKAMVKAQGLVVAIQGRDYPKVEAWTALGSLMGVFPVCVWTRQLKTSTNGQEGWEARVEARTRAREVVGAAEAECLRSEKLWANRDDYALRSMAQTRATSKALRLPLGFVMTLAGFEATPAEEMPSERGVGQSAVTGSAEPDISSEPVPPAEKATPAQVKKAHTVLGIAAKVAGLIPADYAQLLVSRYGTSHFSELSKAQVSEVIGELERMERDADIPFG